MIAVLSTLPSPYFKALLATFFASKNATYVKFVGAFVRRIEELGCGVSAEQRVVGFPEAKL